MAVRFSRCVILHIPKTGSDWLRATTHQATPCRTSEVGTWHSDLNEVLTDLEQEVGDIPLLGTFVRHPLDWYKSAWVYWKETGRFPREEGTPRVECDDFEQFIRNCAEAHPNGYVTDLFERYTGKETGDIPFVGRQENLRDDLIHFLKLAGEEFDESIIRESPPRNVRGQRVGSAFPGYSFRLAKEVLRRERRIIERFY